MAAPITAANARAFAELSRSFFPHLSPADTTVWRRFLAHPPADFQHFDYDVSLGGKDALRMVGPPGDVEQWLTLRKKRVDVVGTTAQDTWVIEVKPTASMAALGQVLTYGFLGTEAGRWRGALRQVVVCEHFDPDLAGVYAANAVACYVCGVAADGSPLVPELVVPLRT